MKERDNVLICESLIGLTLDPAIIDVEDSKFTIAELILSKFELDY